MATEMAMMFSGGTDTTLAAARALEAQPDLRLHLLTFCNGICVGVDRSRIHARELAERYGQERVVHEIKYVTELFHQVRAPLLPLIRDWRSTLVFDLCCRLSMESSAILYARQHGIDTVADGTNVDQGRLFLERPEYMQVARDFFASYGVSYASPVYAPAGGREGRREELVRRGFTVGPKAFERVNITSCLFQQPFCLMAIHTFLFTSFLRKAPGWRRVVARTSLSLEDALAVRLDRQAIARRLIDERLGAPVAGADGQEVRIEDRACSTRLCGRDSVEVAWPHGTRVDLDALAARWAAQGIEAERIGHLLRTTRHEPAVEAYADGRVIVATKDRERAAGVARRLVADQGVLRTAT